MNKVITFILSVLLWCQPILSVTPEEVTDFPYSIPEANYPEGTRGDQKDEARGYTQKWAKRFEIDIRKGTDILADRADLAINRAIKNAAEELRRRGHKQYAEQLLVELKQYDGFVSRELQLYGGFRGIGDHPGIQWMLNAHQKIEALIGETICKAIRTHDIYWLAYAIPVVFSCVDNVNLFEYELHFNIFLGIASYWTTEIICLAATWGTGAGFLCGIVSMAVEEITKRWVAPKLAPTCHSWACKSESYYMFHLPYGPSN
jgi:hypothetical protein